MFIEIDTLVTDDTSIKLMISRGAGNTLKVCVMPCTAGNKTPGLSQPLAIVGTAAELDEGFAGIIQTYETSRSSLANQIVATTDILNAAKSAESVKAVKSLQNSTKNEPVAQIGESDDGSGNGEAPAKPVPPSNSPSLLSLLED